MSAFGIIKQLLLDGVEFQYGKLSLCDLNKYSTLKLHRRYQVYCDDRKEKFFFVYKDKDIDQAIIKFFELKAKVDARIR